MATIEKRGKGYRITVSNGYNVTGKQLREKMTWVPSPEMTQKQIEKEVQRQAMLFEDKVKHRATQDGGIRLVDFTEVYMEQYAKQNLKKKTAFGYQTRMVDINQALGHIRLKDLKPGHIAAFYANLQEEGMRSRAMSIPKIDFATWIEEQGTTTAALSRDTGVSVWTFKQLKQGHAVAYKSAQALAAALGLKYDDTFITQRDNTPLKPGTIHTYHRVLSAVLHQAVKWRYIDSNPAERADLPSIAHRRAKYLDEPDAWRLLEFLQQEPIVWRAIITFDLLSGLRRAELLGLRWCDVDFDNWVLLIRQTWNYVPGVGCYIDTPKTEGSERFLKISRTAIDLLRGVQQWQEQQAAALGDAWDNADDRVFTKEDGTPLFPDSISKWFTTFVKRSGLPPVTVHSLRHTYASLMIAEGTPLVNVSHSLGHAQVSTTTNIYAHVIAAAEARAAAVSDRFSDAVIKLTPGMKPKERKKAAGG